MSPKPLLLVACFLSLACGGPGNPSGGDAATQSQPPPLRDAADDPPSLPEASLPAPPDGPDGPPLADAAGEGGPHDGPDALPRDPALAYACGPLLEGWMTLLLKMLDPLTGLPYDQLACGGPYARPGGVNPAAGVTPQLAYATLGRFVQTGSADGVVGLAFVDAPAGLEEPDRFFAAEIALHLTPGLQTFGGITWPVGADLHRYDRVRVRYATGAPDEVWQLKLNSGPEGERREPPVSLAGTPRGQWVERVFEIAKDFPGTDLAQVNYFTAATSIGLGGERPKLLLDSLVFEANPTKLDSCGVVCGGPFPDLSCHEPMTGAVNIAVVLVALAAGQEVGLVDAEAARRTIAKILGTLELLPGTPVLGGAVTQDWHSPVTGVANPRNSIASLTDQPQLFAALMLVERVMPDLAAAARRVRERILLSSFYLGASACGKLRWSIDRCVGPRPDTGPLEFLGNDAALGSFLAVGSGGAPVCHFSQGLAARGCSLDGPAPAPWYTTGRFCVGEIPAGDTGGPFLQLANLLYLDPARLNLGSLSLGESAANMLRAQAAFARARQLPLFGWASASNPDACGYMACSGGGCPSSRSRPTFGFEQVTPYISAMGLEHLGLAAAANLQAFRAAGAAAPLVTGARMHELGLRDAWNQAIGKGRDAFLALDTGWGVMGLLNACHAGIVRRRFGEHELAQRGYDALAKEPQVCSCSDGAPIEELRVNGRSVAEAADGDLLERAPVKVEWTPSACPAVVQVYRGGRVVFPSAQPNETSRSGVDLALASDPEPYELKVWRPGASAPAFVRRFRVADPSDDLEDDASAWRACGEAPARVCDGSNAECCQPDAAACGIAATREVPDSSATALLLSRQGAKNCHFYLNRPATDASRLRATARFRFAHAESCNNQSRPSVIQALELSLSRFTGSQRFELAAQWMNVGDSVGTMAPALRLWDGHRWVAVALSGSTCLDRDRWHELAIGGRIEGDHIQYDEVVLDCAEAAAQGLTSSAVVSTEAAKVALGIQLDKNAAGDSYGVLVDRVGYELAP